MFESVCSQESDCVSLSFSHSGDAEDKEGGDRKSGRFQDFKAGVPVMTGEFNGLFPPEDTLTQSVMFSKFSRT